MTTKRLAVVCMFLMVLLFSSFSYAQESRFKDLELKGKINNNLDIHMTLIPMKDSAPDNSYTFLYYEGAICHYVGFYHYDKYSSESIHIDGYLYSNGYIWLTEFGKRHDKNGAFAGFIKDDKLIKGVWSNPSGRQYPFYLIDVNTSSEKLNLDIPMDRVGCFERTHSNQFDNASLKILAEADHKFAFLLSGMWADPTVKGACPNTGDIDGIAVYKDNSRTEAEFFQSEGKIKIKFKFSGNHIEVTGNDAFSHCGGMNVSLGGVFIRTQAYEWANPLLD